GSPYCPCLPGRHLPAASERTPHAGGAFRGLRPDVRERSQEWLVLRTATYLARWARGSVAFQAPRQHLELVRDVCQRVLARRLEGERGIAHENTTAGFRQRPIHDQAGNDVPGPR